jgi:hypothetical protein
MACGTKIVVPIFLQKFPAPYAKWATIQRAFGEHGKDDE